MEHKPGTPDRLKDGLAENPILEAKCVKMEANADGLYDTPGLTNQILKHFQSRKTGSGDDRTASGGCLTSGKFPGDSAGIKFSISRILGQQVERDPVAIGTVDLPCRGFQMEERSVEKMEDDFEEEEEEEDERNFSEGEDEEGDGKDGKEGILDDLLEKSQLSDSNSEQTLSWLQCTRYKPPKLPSMVQLVLN